MATIVLDRMCIACRKMIPSDEDQPLIAIVPVLSSYDEKTGRLKGKTNTALKPCLCPDCSKDFSKLVEDQKGKGYKIK